MRVLIWLALTAASVALWWLAAWGAHEGLIELDQTLAAATDGLARDPAAHSWIQAYWIQPAWFQAAWIQRGIDVAFELAQATVAALWILGTLTLLVGMAWIWRTGAERRGWRRSLQRLRVG